VCVAPSAAAPSQGPDTKAGALGNAAMVCAAGEQDPGVPPAGLGNAALLLAAGPTSQAFEPTSTFVLDPALGAAPPANVTTEVRVAGTTFGGPAVPDRYVQIDRPVRSAARYTVYAVPLSEVYDSRAAVSAATRSDPSRSPALLASGGLAWTVLGGQFTVDAVAGDVVLTRELVPEAVGAGAAITIETAAGRMLLDLGLQLYDPKYARPIGEEMARRLGTGESMPAFSEAVLMRGAPDGHLLPYIAQRFAIGEIRATVGQFADARTAETVAAVRSAQTEFRRWLEESLRSRLEGERVSWEAQQPIAPNAGVREARWRRYVAAEVAALLGTVPPLPQLMLAEESFGTTTLTGGPAGESAPGELAPAEPPAVVDVTGVEWEPADDGGLLTVVANHRLLLLPSYGWLLKPKAAPASIAVENLRPAGPTGPTPMAQRPATPWITTPAMGKGALVVARFSSRTVQTPAGPQTEGIGLLIDAGSNTPRLLTDNAMARLVRTAGVSSVEAQLLTHIHGDHVNQVVQMVRRFGITADNVIMSESWVGSAKGRWAEVLKGLRGEFGAAWKPGLAMESTTDAVTEATVRLSGDQTVRVLARGKVQREFRTGGAPEQKVDPASLLFIFGNETSSHRALVLGDARGEDIGLFAKEMGRDAFSAALKGVRVVVGFGHHFSEVAGQNSAADVAGMELLIREALLQNGELTIVIQSSEKFSFGTSTTTPEGRALLDFATRMGARVIFADKPAGGAIDAAAVLNSDLTVSVTGPEVTPYAPDPRTAAALERLQMLREARRTVVENPELGPQHLRSTLSAPELVAALNAEITRLEGHFDDLLGREAATLFELRGDLPVRKNETPAQLAARTAAAKAAFRAARTRPNPLTADQLQAELARQGPVEATLPEDIVAGLRAAVRHGSTLTIEAELYATPRSVAEAIARLPEARRTALEREYRELRELSAIITGNDVPPEKRGELSLRIAALRSELTGAAAELPADQRGQLEGEVRRVEGVLEKLTTPLPGGGVMRNAAGGLGTTEFLLISASKAVNWGVGAAGRAFGTVMMIHSVSGLSDTAAGLAAGTVNVPEAVLRVTHDAMGLQLGIKMFRVQDVGMKKFAILVLLEVGAAAVADYDTAEARNLAVLRAGIHGAVNLLCMSLGMKVMAWGAGMGPTLPGILTVAGGFAVTMAGEPILRLIGLDEKLVRWTAFGPSEVTHVYQDIEKTLAEYEMAVGSVRLSQRDDAALAGLGAARPADLKKRAAEAASEHRSEARKKERELMTLFADAYATAATSYVGLRSLDLLADRFTQLRHQAMDGEPGHDDLQQRFMAIDAKLGLAGMDSAAIAEMDQWDELDDQLDDVDHELDRSELFKKLDRGDLFKGLDRGDLFKELDRAQQMFDNARYRIEPSTLRPVPMIPQGSPAWAAYVGQLNRYDRRLAGQLRRAAELGGGAKTPVSTQDRRFAGLTGDSVDPRSALARMQSLRVAYDERVQEGIAALPALSATETWSDSYRLGRRNEEAHAAHPDLFRRLRLTEMALRIAIGQTRSSLRTMGGTPDPALATLIETETASAERAIEERRLRYGLILPVELDAELTGRRAAEDQLMAATVDAAFPRAGTRPGQAPTPLSPEEIKALHDDELESMGRRMSSTEHQLGEASRLLAPMRETEDPTLPWERMNRLQRQLAVVTGPTFWTLDTKGIDTTEEHTLPAGSTYLVAWIPGESELAPKHLWSFSSTFVRALPINADAVAKFGSGIVYINAQDLHFVSSEDIATRARAAAAPVAPVP